MLPAYITLGRSESLARVVAARLACDCRILATVAPRLYVYPGPWVAAAEAALLGDPEALESVYHEVNRLCEGPARGYFR